ncbi:hypothetical protein [Fluoribacter gormanii]|uniref:Uncharacterized protein n=1 Tax=Fluoribacter gormanii TaxID=464 RepID=A0A377GJV5_9GAMM|nr:hypothetical protein [Fluoribacter gormanii]KTD04270.1 hypothetical protein Lgor_1038 [Fluoribacter gormanii]SIR74721.1 hypothetical protein SAMN05421777_12242 [Fluoribacter gormanii]STO25096.1 Uncharacterised protein [Fluoribacter gormanii]
MNQSLTSLIDKLNRQLQELDLNLFATQFKQHELEQQIQQIKEHINQKSTNSLTINPVTEINWLNFITQQQEKIEAITLDLKNLQDIENKLKDKIKRIKMELKMLANYLERQQTNQMKCSSERHLI